MTWRDDNLATEKYSPDRVGAKLRLVAFVDGVPIVHVLPSSGESTLGRSDDADFTIPDPTISRVHARVRVGESIELVDLDSANGTFVAEKPIEANAPRRLEPTSAFRLGRVTLLLERAAEVDARPVDDEVDSRLRGEKLATLRRLIARTAPTHLNVLVIGETGVGKEVVAEAVHARSGRSGLLVRLNCAAFSPSLLESELFGHARGAFTGADRKKTGLLVQADGGTVFLDEIGDMPLELQPKLLRVIENQQVQPVGALEPVNIDVRFVSATHRSLDKAVAQGTFRADLFYRLNGITLHLPPLRERRDEIAGLAERFIRDFGSDGSLSDGAIRRLVSHPWPGNIRELKNVVERACAIAEGAVIRESDLFLELTPHDQGNESTAPPLQGEAAVIQDALAQFGGNQTRAAQHLGISRSTLVRRLDEYGFSRPKK